MPVAVELFGCLVEVPTICGQGCLVARDDSCTGRTREARDELYNDEPKGEW